MSEAVWQDIDLDTLSDEQRAAYEAYKVAQRQAAALRKGFEDTMQAGLPEGKRLAFGYRFGKLSAAVVEDDRKAGKPKAKATSLADFLAAQAATGGRV